MCSSLCRDWWCWISKLIYHYHEHLGGVLVGFLHIIIIKNWSNKNVSLSVGIMIYEVTHYLRDVRQELSKGGSQGLLQTLMEFSLPNLHLVPWSTTTREVKILHQTKLRLCPRWASMKFLDGKYFSLKTSETTISWLVINLMKMLKAHSSKFFLHW